MITGAAMGEWLELNLARMSLPEDAEGYLLGRALREQRIADIGVVLWTPALVVGTPPDDVFPKQYGGRTGTYVAGFLAFPLRAPSGILIGVEFRSWQGLKRLRQYLLPDAAFSPVFAGLTAPLMAKIWDGGDVWIVEGVFDMAAMEHVIPARDVVLGTLRARISHAHAKFLRRFCRGTVKMVYDRDETGRNMTFGYVDPKTGKRVWGALDSLKRVGISCLDVLYTGGKDPGEIWDAGGVPALQTAFQWSLT